MVIEFLDGVDRAIVTKAQLETYDLLRAKLVEGRKVSSKELLALLGLSDRRPLISRIKHLAEKDFLRLRPETEQEAAAVA